MSFDVYANNGAETWYTSSAWHFLLDVMYLVGKDVLPEKLWKSLCFNGPYDGGAIDAADAVALADRLDNVSDEEICSIPTYCGRTYKAGTDPWPVTPEELPRFREHVQKWSAFLRTSGGVSAG